MVGMDEGEADDMVGMDDTWRDFDAIRSSSSSSSLKLNVKKEINIQNILN